jgi:hypothetical protein
MPFDLSYVELLHLQTLLRKSILSFVLLMPNVLCYAQSVGETLLKEIEIVRAIFLFVCPV